MKNQKKIYRLAPALPVVLALTCGLATALHAQTQFNFTTLRVPGAQDTYAYGISGNYIVGYYTESSVNYNFLYNITSNTYTTLNVPGLACGISGNNVVTAVSTSSYLYNISSGTYSSLPLMEGHFYVHATGISGDSIVGQVAGTTPEIGFLYSISSGGYATLNAPGAQYTSPSGVDGDTVVGTYQAGPGGGFAQYGFIYNGGTYTPLPTIGGVTLVNPTGISGTNIVGGSIIYNGSTYTSISLPAGTGASIQGIDGNNIVGSYGSGGLVYGFLGTPGPPKFGFAMTGSHIQLSISGSSSPTIIQESSNLVNWVSVYTNTPPFTFTESTAASPAQYYRTMTPQ